YTEALRTASFKIVGNAPTLQQMDDLKNAADQKKAYEAQVDAMMGDVRFAKRMIAFWQNTMRLGGAASGPKPSRDTAPTFAARIGRREQAVHGSLPRRGAHLPDVRRDDLRGRRVQQRPHHRRRPHRSRRPRAVLRQPRVPPEPLLPGDVRLQEAARGALEHAH